MRISDRTSQRIPHAWASKEEHIVRANTKIPKCQEILFFEIEDASVIYRILAMAWAMPLKTPLCRHASQSRRCKW